MIQSLDQGHRTQGLIIPGTGDHSPIFEPTPPAPGQGNIDPRTLTFRDDFAVVDVEVTGVDPDVDRIVDVAILRFRNGVPEVFHSLVNPGIRIPPTASAVHHITDEDVANSPYIEDLVEPIRAALDGALAVAHSAQLDALFVDPVTGVEPDPSQWICSLRLAKHLWPQAPAFDNQTLRYWLKTTARSAGLGPHRAVEDCFVTTETFLHQLMACQVKGLRNLAQVREFANRPIVSALCPFRKYQDLPWAEVPADYIQWSLRNRDDLDEDIRYTMEGELDRRATAAVEPSRHLNFGKAHKGKLMAAVPTDYLEWVLRENKDVSPADRLGIQFEMKNRANGHDGFVQRLHTLLLAAPGFRAEADLLAKLVGPAENRCGIFARMLALDAPQWERLCAVIPNDVSAQLQFYAAPELRRSSAPRSSRPRP